MPAKDLGVKHTCWKCGTKFYDLKKPHVVCPKCGANPRDAPVVKPAPAADRRRPAKEEALEETETSEDGELEEEIEDEDGAADEDA